MAEIVRKHQCSLTDNTFLAYRDIDRCDGCGRFFWVDQGWGRKTWRPVGPFKAWRLRRQIALEGGDE